MGTVYRARHLLIDRSVAVKVLSPRLVEDEAARTRFRREAKAAGRLQHPNAVGVTDFGETSDGFVYIVMELLEGKTLQGLLAKDGPLDVAHAVSIMLQVSSAVAAAHEAGIIHRDLKPANIFIVQRSDVPTIVKVLDFGIAKLAAESWDDEDRMNLTQVGAMIGTPRYMSPEQCDDVELTPAADVYSLGVILYEMLTGTVPFSGLSASAIAMRRSSEIPRRPSEFVTTVPPALEDVVMHALEKKPEDRPRDADAFREELLETAERLGLEHAAASTAPSIEALRNAGTESPSGRLVVDLSRLREHRAATSGAGEFPTILKDEAAAIVERQRASEAQPVSNHQQDLRRFDVPIGATANAGWSKRTLAAIAIIVGLVVVLGAVLMLKKTNPPVSQTDAAIAASPTPTASPSPTPSPSPVVSKEEPKNEEMAKREKKGSKVGTVLHKVKKIITKPF